VSSHRHTAARRRTASACLLVLGLGCARTPASRPETGALPVDSATAAAVAAEQGRSAAALRTVAVPPFRVLGGDSTLVPLSFALADFLATDLARSARLQLVERARLGELLRELALTGDGGVDSVSAPRAGRLLAARELLLGALDTLPGGELRLSIRIADVGTGVVAQSLDARAPRRDILAAEKALAFRLFEQLGVTLTPAERARVEERPSGNGEAVLAYGRGVQAELQGDLRAAAGAYLQASRIDPSFRQATERAATMTRALGATASALIPGIRGLEAPVTGVVDRLNRPLDLITTLSRPLLGPADPAFPTTLVTVVIVIQRP
jgi:TolB-like protein